MWLGTSGVNCENTNLTACNATDSCDGHFTCAGPLGPKICLSGFNGTDCKTRTVAPAQDPQCPANIGSEGCKNQGTCFNGSCCCVAGYEGVLCEREILECASIPCQNGGKCVDEVNFYVCQCPTGIRFSWMASVCVQCISCWLVRIAYIWSPVYFVL